MLSRQTFTVGSGGITHFGCGVVEQLGDPATRLSCSRAFLVTDKGVAAAGVSGQVERVLSNAGVAVAVFDDVRPNPSVEDIEAGVHALRAADADVLVAVGGGAVLDVAKGLALVAFNEAGLDDLDYHVSLSHPSLPVIAIPTTAGTGSETNGWGVIEDSAKKRKMYVGHESVIPHVVILDPELTCTLPEIPSAAAGMDVLAHALESLSSPRNNPYAQALCLQVTHMVSRFLPRVIINGNDIEARAQMLLAAHMAGLAFATTGLGMGHALAHALSARLGVAHGTALATLLPHVLSYNLPQCTEMYAQVAWSMGEGDSTRDNELNARAGIDAIRRLSLNVGMPGSLIEIGGSEADIAELAENALADEVIANTPLMPSSEDLHSLLRACLSRTQLPQ